MRPYGSRFAAYAGMLYPARFAHCSDQAVRGARGSSRCRLASLTEFMVYIRIYTMPTTAKLFLNGRSQAVRLPAEFRFEGSEVYVRRDPVTGDVILSRRPESWTDFFDLMKTVEVPEDFPGDRKDAPPQKRDLF